MADTFLARHRIEAPMFSVLLPDALAATDHPYMIHACAFGLYNGPGSGKLVRLAAASVNPWVGATTANNYEKQFLQRITGLTGGEAVEPVKWDHDISSLPSQVQIVRYPSTVTGTGSPYRPLLANVHQTAASIGLWPLAKLYGSSTGNNTIVLYNAPNTETQGIVLREGEGLALNATAVAPYTQTPLEVTVDLLVGTDSYRVNTVVTETCLPHLAIFNGSGSGVLVSVVRITRQELTYSKIGIAGPPVHPALEKFETMDPSSGYAPETLLAFDSATSLPSAITARVGASVKTFGYARGAVIAKPVWHRNPMTAYAIVGGSTGSNWALHRYENAMRYPSGCDPVTLREGEGVGFFMRDPYASGPAEYSFLFTVEDAAGGAPASSGGSYTWMG